MTHAENLADVASSCWCADYPAADIPVIPEGFTFTDSWMAPLWESEALGLGIITEYLEREKRDDRDGARFTVYRLPPEEGDTPEDIFKAENWPDVEAFIAKARAEAPNANLPLDIANAFTARLREVLTPEQWAEMQRRNASPEYGDSVCASHDFCDANMPMAEAFAAVMGREPAMGFETHYDATLGRHVADDPEAEAQAKSDASLWGAAWDIAKDSYLTGKREA